MNNMNSWACSSCAIGGDHAGYELKNFLLGELREVAVLVEDCGAYDETPSDFPDFAELIARQVLSGKVERGILVCGSGVGVCVAANKIPGIRAGLCHDTYSAHQGVEHDDMNVLCIGARIIGPALAREIVTSFLQASYQPQPRHQQRVEKILQLEQRALRGEFSL